MGREYFGPTVQALIRNREPSSDAESTTLQRCPNPQPRASSPHASLRTSRGIAGRGDADLLPREQRIRGIGDHRFAVFQTGNDLDLGSIVPADHDGNQHRVAVPNHRRA